MPTPARPSDVGPVYDILLATRDGSQLACKNRDGKTVNISQCAYMTQALPSRPVVEETELEHKASLVRLSSPNVIDREFDQWPQASQGDWSGGEMQRIFGEPNRYWQGRGLPWPSPSVLPTYPTTFVAVEGNFTGQIWNPLTAGFWSSGSFGAAFAYSQGAGNVSVRGNSATVWTGPPPSQATDLIFMLGHLYLITNSNASVYDVTQGVSPALVFTAVGTLAQTGANRLAGTTIGAIGYLAVSFSAPGISIRLFSVINPVSMTSFVDLNIPANTKVLSMAFAGTKLYYVVGDGSFNTLMVYDLITGTVNTVVDFRGYTQIEMIEVAGAIAIVAGTISFNNFQTLDIYLLQGLALQFVTTMPWQLTNFGGTLFSGPFAALSKMASFGPYAFFYVGLLQFTGGTLNNWAGAVYAYDVIRGAIYRVIDTFSPAGVTSNIPPLIPGLAIVTGLTSASIIGALGNAPWAICINTYGSGVATAGRIELAPFLPIVAGASRKPDLSGTIISSVFDYGTVLNKLWRQIVVTHAPIPSPPANGQIRIAAYLDTDLEDLGVADYSISNTTPGTTETVLTINKLARKLVYELDYGVTRVISVAIRVSTGWVQTMYLDLGPNSLLNSKAPGDYCFQKQGLDHVAAYNFLRQLWRQQGGQCTASFPNGDSGPWLIQDFHTESPKPFGASFRADQPSSLQSVGYLKIREDG